MRFKQKIKTLQLLWTANREATPAREKCIVHRLGWWTGPDTTKDDFDVLDDIRLLDALKDVLKNRYMQFVWVYNWAKRVATKG